MYDTTTHLCCASDTIILKQTPNSKCCGHDKSYDPETQTCCPMFKQVYDIAEGACCMVNETHEVAFDPETHTCCSTFENGKDAVESLLHICDLRF